VIYAAQSSLRICIGVSGVGVVPPGRQMRSMRRGAELKPSAGAAVCRTA